MPIVFDKVQISYRIKLPIVNNCYQNVEKVSTVQQLDALRFKIMWRYALCDQIEVKNETFIAQNK